MTAALRPLGELDARRADAVARFIARHDDSPGTRRTLVSALGTIAEVLNQPRAAIATLPWELLADTETYDILEVRIAARVGPRSRAKLRWALNGLLHHLVRVGIADHEALARTLSDTKRSTRPAGPAGRAVTGDDLAAMLRACRRDPNTPRGARDAAVLALLAGTGPRRAEIARVTLDDTDLDQRTITYTKKGGGLHVAALTDAPLAHLHGWLDHHDITHGPLFVPVSKNGAITTGQAINDRSIHRIVTQRRDQANAHHDITPHSFRRFFVTSLLDAGIDLLTTMRAVGHASPTTTQLYDRRPPEHTRAAIQHIHIPTPDDLDEDG